jgi:hypothetical protein
MLWHWYFSLPCSCSIDSYFLFFIFGNQTFGRIEIEDNRRRQELTEASMEDNAGSYNLMWLVLVDYSTVMQL